MDLLNIKKRVRSNAQFWHTLETTKVTLHMKVFGIVISEQFRIEQIQDLRLVGIDAENEFMEILINKFIEQNLEIFVRLENRNRNLTTLFEGEMD